MWISYFLINFRGSNTQILSHLLDNVTLTFQTVARLANVATPIFALSMLFVSLSSCLKQEPGCFVCAVCAYQVLVVSFHYNTDAHTPLKEPWTHGTLIYLFPSFAYGRVTLTQSLCCHHGPVINNDWVTAVEMCRTKPFLLFFSVSLLLLLSSEMCSLIMTEGAARVEQCDVSVGEIHVLCQ